MGHMLKKYEKVNIQQNTKQLKQTKNRLKENKKAIAEFNKRVSKNGLFSDVFRKF